MNTAAAVLERKKIRDEVRSCQGCSLYRSCTAPVPFSGPSPSVVAVVGEAPGRYEDRRGEPFVGPAGARARSLLNEAGISPETVAWANVVSCFPNRTPTPDEVLSCRGNLQKQLATIHPYFVLVFGGVAVSAFHEIRIGAIRGRWWRMRGIRDEPWALATWHPAAALRNSGLIPEIERDIRLFKWVVDGRVPLTVDETCVKCGNPGTVSKEIAYCHLHDPITMNAKPKRPRIERDKSGSSKGKLGETLL